MKKGNSPTTQSSYRLDRTILIIAAIAFIPIILLFQYLQHNVGVLPLVLVKALPILHVIAEYLSVFVSISIFLLAWHTYPDRRDTFILFLGNALLIVGLLSMFDILYYQQNHNFIGDFVPLKHHYFFVMKHILLPLGLLFSVFAVGKAFSARRRFYYLLGTIFFFIIVLGAGLYLTSCLPDLLPDKYGVSDLINRKLLTVPLYAVAMFTYYKKRPFTGSKPNALFLSAIVFCTYSEACSSGLCFEYENYPLKGCNPFSHLFEIVAYVIIYWVVFVSSIRYPYKTLYKVKESLAENYRELSSALEMSGQSEERYRLLVENSNDLIYTLDAHSHITFVNQKITALTGYRPAELYGKSVFDLLTPESQKKAIAQTRTLLKTGQAQVEDLEILTKDGKKRDLMVNVQPVHDTEGRTTGFQGIARDISERRQRQEQMLHSERLATVGLMASSIAHEIGTPLNIISGNAEFLLADLPGHHPMREELETIVDQCQRISDQVKTLLDFSRPSPLHLAPLDTDKIICNTLQLLKHMIKPDHDIELNLAPDLPPLMGDKYKLQQLLINLLLNAFQAMPAGGSLRINTSLISKSSYSGAETAYIEVRIQDSGYGIPKENLKHIFAPFFTTKNGGLGTGLGLSVCLRIVKDHGGVIGVESEVNKGTTFTIHLPVNVHLGDMGPEGNISHE